MPDFDWSEEEQIEIQEALEATAPGSVISMKGQKRWAVAAWEVNEFV